MYIYIYGVTRPISIGVCIFDNVDSKKDIKLKINYLIYTYIKDKFVKLTLNNFNRYILCDIEKY